MTNQNKPLIGASLYSFTNEWQQRLYSLDQLVEKVAEYGLGPGVEVVGFQSFRDYPDVSEKTARHFRNQLERHGLVPTCLGGNLDIGRRPERLMTDEEKFDYIERQIISAEKLGFPVLRVQIFMGPELLERLAPTAERAGVHLACELHSPLNGDHPEVVKMRQFFERIRSPYLGFIPDFSATMTSVPAGYWANLRHLGAPEALIEGAKEIWITDKPIGEKFAGLAEIGARFGIDAGLVGKLNSAMTMFGHAQVETWRAVLPFVRHIHGKFYEVDESGNEPSIPYPQLMSLLKETGYQGSMSAEWEGQAFTEETIGIQQVRGWHAMCTRLLAR